MLDRSLERYGGTYSFTDDEFKERFDITADGKDHIVLEDLLSIRDDAMKALSQ